MKRLHAFAAVFLVTGCAWAQETVVLNGFIDVGCKGSPSASANFIDGQCGHVPGNPGAWMIPFTCKNGSALVCADELPACQVNCQMQCWNSGECHDGSGASYAFVCQPPSTCSAGAARRAPDGLFGGLIGMK